MKVNKVLGDKENVDIARLKYSFLVQESLFFCEKKMLSTEKKKQKQLIPSKAMVNTLRQIFLS